MMGPAHIARNLNPQAFRKAGYEAVKLGKIYHTGEGFEDPDSWDFDLIENNTAKKPPKDQIEKEWSAARAIRLKVEDKDAWDGKLGRQGVEWLGKLAGKDKPFFLAVGFRRPHAPYIAPGKYWDMYSPIDMKMREEPADHLKAIPKLAFNGSIKNKLTAEDWLIVRQSYRASISYMDAQVGLLLDELDRQKLWDNTIVVFTSDHGYHLGEHGGMWHKQSLFEAAARVPLIVVAPKVKAASSSGLIELVDLYPTLGELCRVSVPADLAGVSFAPLLTEPTRKWKPAAFTQQSRVDDKADPSKPAAHPTGRSIRTDRWRYTEWNEGKDGVELYDYDKDPFEYCNLANDAALAKEREQLRTLLHTKGKGNIPPIRSS